MRHCAPRPSFENGHLRHTAEKRKTNAAMAEAAKTAAAPAAAAGAKTTSEARNFSRSMNVTRRNGSIPGEGEGGEKSQASEEKSKTSKSERRGKKTCPTSHGDPQPTWCRVLRDCESLARYDALWLRGRRCPPRSQTRSANGTEGRGHNDDLHLAGSTHESHGCGMITVCVCVLL